MQLKSMPQKELKTFTWESWSINEMWFCHHGDAIASKALCFHLAIYIISVGKVIETEKGREKPTRSVRSAKWSEKK